MLSSQCDASLNTAAISIATAASPYVLGVEDLVDALVHARVHRGVRSGELSRKLLIFLLDLLGLLLQGLSHKQ
jgi:hypothetical protein